MLSNTGFAFRLRYMKMKEGPLIRIYVRKPFHLGYMVSSHGFIDLPPFGWDREAYCLHMVVRTKGDKAFALKIATIKDNRKGQTLG